MKNVSGPQKLMDTVGAGRTYITAIDIIAIWSIIPMHFLWVFPTSTDLPMQLKALALQRLILPMFLVGYLKARAAIAVSFATLTALTIDMPIIVPSASFIPSSLVCDMP
jgi:hypothetical protein